MEIHLHHFTSFSAKMEMDGWIAGRANSSIFHDQQPPSHTTTTKRISAATSSGVEVGNFSTENSCDTPCARSATRAKTRAVAGGYWCT